MEPKFQACKSCGDSVDSGTEKTGPKTTIFPKDKYCGDCWGELVLKKLPDVVTVDERRALMRSAHTTEGQAHGRTKTDS